MAILKQKYNEYVLTEEELGAAFYSKGHELIMLAEDITFQTLKMIYREVYNSQESKINIEQTKNFKCVKV